MGRLAHTYNKNKKSAAWAATSRRSVAESVGAGQDGAGAGAARRASRPTPSAASTASAPSTEAAS